MEEHFPTDNAHHTSSQKQKQLDIKLFSINYIKHFFLAENYKDFIFP